MVHGRLYRYVALYYGILVFRFKFIKGTATAEHLMYPYLGFAEQSSNLFFLFFSFQCHTATHPLPRRPHVSNEALRNWTLKDWLWSNIPPIKLFIVMGLMDSIGSILGLIAFVIKKCPFVFVRYLISTSSLWKSRTPYISGPMSSLMSQTIVAFSMLCALVILRTKFVLHLHAFAFVRANAVDTKSSAVDIRIGRFGLS
jgi:hypothetical protein